MFCPFGKDRIDVNLLLTLYYWKLFDMGDMMVCLSRVSVCLFVYLYPINVKTAEPIGPKFCVGSHMIAGKNWVSSELQKCVFNILNFLFLKSTKKNCKFVKKLFLFYIAEKYGDE